MRTKDLLLVAAVGLLAACSPQRPHTDEEQARLVDGSGLEPLTREATRELRRSLEVEIGGDAGPERIGPLCGRLGEEFHARELLDRAAMAYAAARRALPGEGRWSYLAGMVALEDGRPEDALERLIEAERDGFSDAPVALRLGEVLLTLDRPEEATPWFDQAVVDRSIEAAARFGLGRAALASNDPATAVRELEAALALEPGATRVHYALGMALRNLGDADAAAVALASVGEVSPRLPDRVMAEVRSRARTADSLVARGNEALARGDVASAAAAYRVATERHPNDAEAWASLGAALRAGGDDAAAYDAFGHSARLAPEDPRIQDRWARVLLDRGETERAIEAFGRAIELDPGNVDARAALGALLATRDPASALIELEAAVASGRTSATIAGAWFNIGQIAAARGDGERAETAWTQALALAPEHTAARVNLANLFARSSRLEEAAGYYRIVLERDETNVPARLGLALLKVRARELGAARTILERGPDHPEIAFALDRLAELERGLARGGAP